MIPTDYRIRESRRAKHVRLRVCPHQGLEVVIPPGFDPKAIPEILLQKQRWLDKVFRQIESHRQLNSTQTKSLHEPLPSRIDLVAIGESWPVCYRATTHPHVRLREQDGILQVSGAIEDISSCRHVLRQWLAHKARIHLTSWLHDLSRSLNLPFQRLTIRGQKTRWGSCTSRRTISLNYKLLLIPPQLVNYVLIHELCHTIHLNHSPHFWDLVQSHQPDARLLDKQLRSVRYTLPTWLED